MVFFEAWIYGFWMVFDHGFFTVLFETGISWWCPRGDGFFTVFATLAWPPLDTLGGAPFPVF